MIDTQWENKGLGTKLFNNLERSLLQDAKRQGKSGPDAVIFEVEKSELAQTDAQRQIDLRRIRFFRSVGGQIINAQYFSLLLARV